MTLPVVFLTSHPELVNEELAFERGALDFVDKTRGVEILASRLRLVSASGKLEAHPQPEDRIVYGELALGPAIHRAYWNDVDIGLTASEYDIVHFLVSSVGLYRTYREIYDVQHYEGFAAGHGELGFQTNVRSTIKRIRRKFCKIDPTFSEIQTLPGLGYRWRGRIGGDGLVARQAQES